MTAASIRLNFAPSWQAMSPDLLPTPWDPFEEIRAEFHVRPPGVIAVAKAAAKAKRAAKTAPKLWDCPSPPQGPRELEPWATDTFDPSSEALLRWVEWHPALTGLLIGARVYQVGDRRWIVMQNSMVWWTGRPWLAYPIPDGYPEDPYEGAHLFQNAWREERDRRARFM